MEKTYQIIVTHRPVETAMRNKTCPFHDVRKAMAARVMMSARKEKFMAVEGVRISLVALERRRTRTLE